jgi:hypothetical protein
MDCTNVPHRSLRMVGRLAVWMASAALASPTLAAADQLDQHNQLVNQFVNDMHADPLVADCAAHGSFVASTSTAFDHVEFAPSAFDNVHASVTPWNDSFDEGKQRVKVDNVVTVDGIGIRSGGGGDPADLHFRCGYVGTQMLAFSWNDPVPPARQVHGTVAPAAGAAGSYAAPGQTAPKKSGSKTARTAANHHTTNHTAGHSTGHSSGKATAKATGKSSAKSASKTSASKSAGSKKAASPTSKKKH